jgi:hypothetical protein
MALSPLDYFIDLEVDADGFVGFLSERGIHLFVPGLVDERHSFLFLKLINECIVGVAFYDVLVRNDD